MPNKELLEDVPSKGERVYYKGVIGEAIRRDLSGDAVWVRLATGVELMFTRRRGNVFRAFPGPANGPALDKF